MHFNFLYSILMHHHSMTHAFSGEPNDFDCGVHVLCVQARLTKLGYVRILIHYNLIYEIVIAASFTMRRAFEKWN